jgi:short subunit dehydrogenase-like uncharacterized protein
LDQAYYNNVCAALLVLRLPAKITYRFHYTATKSGAIIIPSCGLDSLPADITAYISSKTLRDHSGQRVDIDTSLSAYSMSGGMSGGTIGTGITTLEQVPKEELRVARKEYSISPGNAIRSSLFANRREAD